MKSYFGFNKSEVTTVFITFLIVVGLTLANLQISFRKSRDAQRKADVRSYYDRLQAFQAEYGFYPEAVNGQIKGCNPKVVGEELVFEICGPAEESAFFEALPIDPKKEEGFDYVYVSNQKHFQVYASLEGSAEDEYDSAIAARDLRCGNQICNFGRSDGRTPLDKSLETYENELNE